MTKETLWGSSLARGILGVLAVFCVAVAVAVGFTLHARAEDPSPRKLLTHVSPKYPEYLKAHEIGGVVRLTVVVSAAGNVKSITPIGGNPILVDAAVAAVKQWKYAPSEGSDTFEVKLDFVPPQQ